VALIWPEQRLAQLEVVHVLCLTNYGPSDFVMFVQLYYLCLFAYMHSAVCSYSQKGNSCTVYAAKDQILSFYTSTPLEYVDIDMSVCAQ
jgi:hypothetical protein